jgi:hypothetical protein
MALRWYGRLKRSQRVHSDIDDETLERVARAMCRADGSDPDEARPTGKRTAVRAAHGITDRALTEPMWKRYEQQARIHIAADHAIRNR